jgi:hypothetical protein
LLRGCSGFSSSEPLELEAESLAVEDVVAQHQRAALAADEVRADREGLGEALRLGLLGICERHSEP